MKAFTRTSLVAVFQKLLAPRGAVVVFLSIATVASCIAAGAAPGGGAPAKEEPPAPGKADKPGAPTAKPKNSPFDASNVTPWRLARRTVLPKVDFKERDAREVLEEVPKLFKAVSPDGKVIRFWSSEGVQQAIAEKKVTLSMEKVTLGAVLSQLEVMMGVEFADMPEGLIVRLFPPKEPAVVAPAPVEKLPPLLAKAQRLIVHKVDFREKNLVEVVLALEAFAREADPEEKGISFRLDPAILAKAKDKTVTLSLNDVPLLELMKYVANLCDLRYEEKDGRVVFSKVK